MKKLNFILVIIMFAGSLIFYNSLPDLLPMHWNIRGQVDNYMPKNSAVWFLPVITTIMLFLFAFLPKFDPKKEKYALFAKEWTIIQTGLIGFMAYLHFVIFYVAINPHIELPPLLFIGLGAVFILLGNYLSKIRQNYFVGIRVPWTLANEDNWNKTHRFASWCFVIAGIVTIVEAYFVWYAPVIIFGVLFLAGILPVIYSFLLFKKSIHKMKYVYLVLVSVVLLIFVLRLTSGEDDWICQNGEWVKHGQPTALMPSTSCR